MHIKQDISNWKYWIHSQRFNYSKGQVIQNYNLPVECNNLNVESDQSEPLGNFFGKRHFPKKSVNFRD